MRLLVYLLLAFLLFVAAFVTFRVFVRRDYRRLGRLTLFSALLETFVFLCHGLVTLTYLPSDWPALHVGRLHAGMGAVPVILGLAVVIAGMTNVGLRNTFGQPGGLKQTGVYTLTRNPQIVGYGLFVVGIAILWPSWYALGWVILYAAPHDGAYGRGAFAQRLR